MSGGHLGERFARPRRRVVQRRELDRPVGKLHCLDRTLVLAQFTAALDLRERKRGLCGTLAQGALEQFDRLARAVFPLGEQKPAPHPFGKIDLRIGIAAIGGEPPVALGGLRLRA